MSSNRASMRLRKLKLFFACLLMAVLSIGQMWADKVTAVANIESGKKYYIGATKSDNSDWYLSVADNGTVTGKKQGTAVSASDPTNAAVFTFTSTSGGWTIQFESGKYLTLPTSKDNGKVYVQDDAANWTITNVSAKALMNFKIGDFCLQRNSSSSLNFGSYASGQLDLWLEPVSSGDPDVCATPTFSPAAGAVLSGTTVSISCATSGATIHYTTDGTAPTTSSSVYSSAITVNADMTIKAIAVKSGMTNSAEASASYTILTPKTIAQVLNDISATEGAEFLLNDVTVTYAYGSNVYVKDASGYMLVYSSISGAANGKVLQGLQGKAKLYNQLPEISTVTKAPTVTDGSAVEPEALTAYPVAADLNKYVTMEDVTFASAATLSGTVVNINGTFDNATLIIRNTFKLNGVSVETGKSYRVVGIVQKYNSDYQVYPITIEEIVDEGAPEAPTFNPAAGEYTAAQSVELSCATEGAKIYYTIDGTTPTSSSTEYSAAISVGESMTIKAIAVKNEKSSGVATAAYTINLPVSEEDQKTWNLAIDETATASADALTWTATYVSMSFAKGTSTTNANNYYPGTSGQSYTSTRTYKNSVITITPASSKQITTVVFTATTSGYATTLKNASWTNATAVASDVTVTVTASGSGAISAVLGGTAGFSSVTVHYEPYVAPATYAISFATPANGSLTIANGVTPIASGDEFEEGTELTISTEPAPGYILSAIKVIETGSDPENDVTSTVLSGTTLTVPDYAITVSATFVENVAPEATLILSENGVAAPFAGEHHQGDVVNLPLTSSADCVKDFVGWSANASCAVAPEYAPGAEYTLASTSQTLYAVYATASGTSYVKTALADIASGSEVIVTETKGDDMWALSYNPSTSKTVAAAVSEDENILEVSSLTNGFWTLSKDGDNFTLTVVGGTDKLYCNNSNDGVRVGSGDANTFSINNNYLYTSATSDARYLGAYNGTEFRCYTSINSNITGQTLAFYKKTATYSDYATTCVAALADPVFTPAAGVYTEAKNVVITAEEGTIYYTTDGTDPTSASTEYTVPIVLDANGTTTIKAIAISATSESAVVSATYTINLPLSTIQAVYDKAVEVGSIATEVNIAFNNWVVSGISTDNKNVYVTDGTKGFVIYDSEADHGFAVNDKLNGTVATSLKLYNKFADVIGLKANAEGLTVTHDGVVTPVAATIADLGAVNTGAPIILNGVLFDGSVLSDGVNSITPYTTFYADAFTSLESGKYYDITGIYVHYNTTKQVAPRSAADIAESVLADPEISYDPASDEITKGEEASWSAPSLINEHGVTIASYASDNEEVATVTDGGVISLAGGIGTAVITAHSNATPTYAAGNATYTITVNAPAPAPSGTTYRKVTATADITDGEYLIVYEGDATHDAYAFNGSLENIDQAKKGVAVTINENVITGTTEIDAAVFTINVTAGTLQSASGWYIGRETNSNGMDKSETTEYVNTFAITDGKAVITGTSGCTLRYNYAADQLRFRYYTSGQRDIQLYKKETPEPPTPSYTEVRDGLTEGWYYTMCLDKDVTAVQGGSIWRVLSKAANGTDVILEEVLGTLDAGRPYIFRASASTLQVAYTGDAVGAPVTEGNNGLVGSFTQELITESATNFIIYENALYFVNSEAYVGANRAYLDMTGVPAYSNEPQQGNAPRRRVTMAVHGPQVATGMDALNASDAPAKVLINGQLFILRGEKMYNVNGQLVK